MKEHATPTQLIAIAEVAGVTIFRLSLRCHAHYKCNTVFFHGLLHVPTLLNSAILYKIKY